MDGVNQYLYDGEGRICAVFSAGINGMTTMTGYLYDAEGTRVAKGGFSTWSCDPAVNGFNTTNDYILGPGGEQMTEMGVQAQQGSAPLQLAWQHTNVWAGGKLLATYDPTGLHFYFNDPLGSRRVQTDSAGVVERTCQSLPFGDGETCLPTPTENLFTGKERDAESGNDYFGARYFAPSMGRFMSPDWSAKGAPVPYAKLGDPQTLNLSAYVRNNPLGLVDYDGHGFFDVLKKTWNDTMQLVANTKVTVEVGIGLKFASKMGGGGAGATAHLQYSNREDPLTGNKLKIRIEADVHSMDGRGLEKGIELQPLNGGPGTDIGPYTERTDTAAGPHDSSISADETSVKADMAIYDGTGGGANVSLQRSDLNSLGQDLFALRQDASSGIRDGVRATKQAVSDAYYQIMFALY